jgi:hypothetical protein
MKGWIRGILVTTSLLLCIAIVIFWVKSYSLGDSAGWGWIDAGRNQYRRLEWNSISGSMSVGGYSFVPDPAFPRAPSLPDAGPFWSSNMAPMGHRAWFDAHAILGVGWYNRTVVGGKGGGNNVWNDWGIVLPDWFLVASLLVLPAFALRRYLYNRQRRLRRRAGQCVHCGYDLRASVGRCPECGTIVQVM